MASSTACPLSTGSEPGRPSETGSDVGVGLVPEVVRGAREHLGGGGQLGVDLEPDHRLPPTPRSGPASGTTSPGQRRRHVTRTRADDAGDCRHMRTVLTTGANSGIGLATVVEVAGGASARSARCGRRPRPRWWPRRRPKPAWRSRRCCSTSPTPSGAARWSASSTRVRPGQQRRLRRHRRHRGRRGRRGPGRCSRRWSSRRCGWPGSRSRPCGRAATGRIVNVSSIYGRTTTPLTGWYQAAKHALEALTDALRIEVAAAA